MKPDVVEVYAALRRDHPARPLPRDMEEWMILEVMRLRDEVQAERAAVVAMLRAEANAFDVENSDPLQTMFRCGACMSLINAADDIERGEHRREEGA